MDVPFPITFNKMLINYSKLLYLKLKGSSFNICHVEQSFIVLIDCTEEEVIKHFCYIYIEILVDELNVNWCTQRHRLILIIQKKRK